MRVVLDLEATQSPQSRHRGIGRYSMSLAREMLRQGRDRGHEFIVALNATYDGTVGPVREALDGCISQSNIVSWHASMPPHVAHDPTQRRAFESVRESFFAGLDADVVHVASLFEHGPYSFTTIGTGPGRHRTAVTLYDLIPHVNRSVYLYREQDARNYDAMVAHLKRADLLLAISEASRQEGIEHLGFSGDRIVNISSAADPHFTAATPSVQDEVRIRADYGLYRPFVMYTGGIDPRKNIARLIESWSKLPADLRKSHQLAIVCSVQPNERAALEEVAARAGLDAGELVITGYVPEADLVDLYRMCRLFVFPSLHEGFGLPALEAMRCGAPVIGANNSSIPEVIGRDDALFDAHSVDAIAAAIRRPLQDRAFRAELVRHGGQQAQKFSWQHSALTALEAIERLGPVPRRSTAPAKATKPKLAYLAPLPPQRSGIADYSAELLPALAQHYDIDVVIEQPRLDEHVRASVAAERDAAWFLQNGGTYDRILYHFGNSNYHEYMVPLLKQHPGTVVMHDFFMSGMQANREFVTEKEPHWSRALYESHGWGALAARYRAADMTPVIHEYPANFDVLKHAQGVIVHSPFPRELAKEWYGPGTGDGWREIPHLRVALDRHHEQSRHELGFGPGDIVVCSFGIMGQTKLNHRLLRAWKDSPLASDPRCHLVFVGENDAHDYGKQLLREMESAGGRVRITGWASPELFRQYLNAADIAVQLRALSRGETSGTVLDAMCHGVPVIANANGSMAWLPREAVMLLDEEFTDAQLVDALTRLREDAGLRTAMGNAGRSIIETRHAPAHCAAMYAQAIEDFAAQPRADARSAAETVGPLLSAAPPGMVASVAQALAHNHPEPFPARKWLVDVTRWKDAPGELPETLAQLFHSRFPGWRAEPVYRDADGRWRYARALMLSRDWAPAGLLEDAIVEMREGDVWGPLGDDIPAEVRERALRVVRVPDTWHPDTIWPHVASHAGARGVPKCFVDISELVRHDWQSGIQRVVKHWLLELLREPPAGYEIVPVFTAPQHIEYRVARDYIRAAAGIDSRSAVDSHLDGTVEPREGDLFFALDLQPHFIVPRAELLARWRARGAKVAFMVYDLLPVNLPECFFPGAAQHHEAWLDVVARSDMAICISRAVETDLAQWLAHKMPGEPAPALRHVHLGADIGERIGTRGMPVEAPSVLDRMRSRPAFLMVGTLEPRKAHAAVLAAFEQLWADGSDAMLVIAGRKGWMVDELIARLRAHPERGARLEWLDDASDEYLEELYRASTAMILASRGEGFGLPLVEAAQRGIPVIARDLPVFREVAGEHAHYFADDDAIAGEIETWLRLHARGAQPRPEGMPWLTWARSAARLRRILQELQQP